ncbi:MAG: hypothetical protein ACLFTI_11455 [Anaerolineales bacterium]
MHIVTPTKIEQVAWEGRLEPLTESFTPKSAASYRVTLGEPVVWPAEAAMESETGRAWTPPASLVARRYTLVRLSCTLHPLSDHRSHYAEATLRAYLCPRYGDGKVVAHDLFPKRETVEETGAFKLGLGPELKFVNLVDVKLLEVGAEIEYPQVHPVIEGYGLGESNPYWRFIHHSGNPLAGCQSVYAVLAAPADADGIRLTIELIATVKTRFGPIRLGLPEEANAHVSCVIAGQPGD